LVFEISSTPQRNDRSCVYTWSRDNALTKLKTISISRSHALHCRRSCGEKPTVLPACEQHRGHRPDEGTTTRTESRGKLRKARGKLRKASWHAPPMDRTLGWCEREGAWSRKSCFMLCLVVAESNRPSTFRLTRIGRAEANFTILSRSGDGFLQKFTETISPTDFVTLSLHLPPRFLASSSIRTWYTQADTAAHSLPADRPPLSA
jgi:hypothetical protein